MSANLHHDPLSRRHFLLGSTAMAALTALITPSSAQTALPTGDDVIKAITKDVKPAEGKVALDLPEIAENGNTVPFSFTVESPMTAADHVKAVHIIAPAIRAPKSAATISPRNPARPVHRAGCASPRRKILSLLRK